MTSRDSFLNPTDTVVAAPGPGQYDPRFPQDVVKVSFIRILIYTLHKNLGSSDICHFFNHMRIF